MTDAIFPKKVVDRFWSKVEIREESECWLWKAGGLKKDGRGIFFNGNRTITAPRFSLFLKLNYEFPTNLFACHSCDNPKCVNPSHLYLGTNQDNIIDAASKNRLGSQKKETCLRGHSLTGNNLGFSSWGARKCLQCDRQKKMEWGKVNRFKKQVEQADESVKEKIKLYVERELQNSAEYLKLQDENKQITEKLRVAKEALEKNKSEWEAVKPDGYKHLVAWQISRDAIKKLEDGNE